MDQPSFSRRDFLKTLGGAIFVMVGAGRMPAQETAGAFHAPPTPVPQEASAWLHIDDMGKVTVFTGKVEFGQNAQEVKCTKLGAVQSRRWIYVRGGNRFMDWVINKTFNHLFPASELIAEESTLDHTARAA